MVQAGIATKNIQLKVADNTTMQAYVARPAYQRIAARQAWALTLELLRS
jgi:hypothetical protein